MGTELKTPENCETFIRNRKQKGTSQENGEKLKKSQTKVTEIVADVKLQKKLDLPSKDDDVDSENSTSNKKTIENSIQEIRNVENSNENRNFTIKIEFDPMSIALFTLAIITRFFRLAEPRNVV
jgi:hypothetical protein